jgi:4-amino-4-deoxy-L-arabinose transferase-like glycosyltransferase
LPLCIIDTKGVQGVIAGSTSPSRRGLLWTAVLLYLLAVGVRLLFLTEARHNPLYQFLILDERSQHEVAVVIAQGTLPPHAPVKAPFYALCLGMLYKVIGPHDMEARYVQVFVAGLAPVLVFLITCRLFDRTCGLLAGGLACLYWMFVFFSAELLDVTLASVFYLLLAWVLISTKDVRWWKWFGAGALIGLGAITRPNILAFAPVLAIMVLAMARREARASRAGSPGRAWLRAGAIRAACLTAGTALAIAPVTLWNVCVAHERMLIAYFGGYNLYVANNPQSDGKNAISPKLDITVRLPGLDLNDPWVKWDEGFQAGYLYAAQYLGPRPKYAEVEKFYYWLTVDYIRHHPGKFLSDTFKRSCWLVNAYEYPNNKDKYHFLRFSRTLWALSWVHFGLVGPVGVVGLVLSIRRKTWVVGTGYYVAMILSLALSAVFFVVNARYRLPIVYLLMPMVAYGAREIVGLFKRPVGWRRATLVTGSLAGLMVLSNLNPFSYRPPYHDYLLFSLAGACGAVGRADLMAEAVDQIEKSLEDKSHRQTLHPWAMTCLFNYFRDQGNLSKAAHYGWMMLKTEPVDPQMIAVLVDVLIRVDRRDQARQAIEVLRSHSNGQPNLPLAQAMFLYAKAYRDLSMMQEAVQVYEALMRVQPGELQVSQGLTAAKTALESMQPKTSSSSASQGS